MGLKCPKICGRPLWTAPYKNMLKSEAYIIKGFQNYRKLFLYFVYPIVSRDVFSGCIKRRLRAVQMRLEYKFLD